MFQIDIVISVLCIYWDLPYIILSWDYSSTWIPLLEEKYFQFWTGFSDVPVSILIKLVNRWRCSLAPHPDIRSVEWGGLWIKDKYSIFEDKLQNSHYAQIHTYILSNKLLRSDSVQSTGLNESKKRENTRELGAWWREGKVPERSEQDWKGDSGNRDRQTPSISPGWPDIQIGNEEQTWDTYRHWFPFPPVKHLKSQSLYPGSWLCLSIRLHSQVFSASAREDIL